MRRGLVSIFVVICIFNISLSTFAELGSVEFQDSQNKTAKAFVPGSRSKSGSSRRDEYNDAS